MQKYQTVDKAVTNAGITRPLSPQLLPRQAIESISIKEEFFDTNDTNSYAYNSGPSITISEDQFGKKRSIVWKYFNINATAPAAAICMLCGRRIKCGKVEAPRSYSDLCTGNLWQHLELKHAAIYNQQKHS
jgi:hypothetical protein